MEGLSSNYIKNLFEDRTLKVETKKGLVVYKVVPKGRKLLRIPVETKFKFIPSVSNRGKQVYINKEELAVLIVTKEDLELYVYSSKLDFEGSSYFRGIELLETV